MANPFDEFDTNTGARNPFDEFDEDSAQKKVNGVDASVIADARGGDNAFLKHAANAATLGFTDELAAPLAAGAFKLTHPESTQSFNDIRKEMQGNWQNDLSTSAVEHPIASIGGEIAGSIPATKAIGAVSDALGLTARLAPQSRVGQLLASTAAGAGAAEVSGIGNAQGDPLERVKETGIVTPIVGGVLGGASNLVGQGIDAYTGADQALTPVAPVAKELTGGLQAGDVTTPSKQVGDTLQKSYDAAKTGVSDLYNLAETAGADAFMPASDAKNKILRPLRTSVMEDVPATSEPNVRKAMKILQDGMSDGKVSVNTIFNKLRKFGTGLSQSDPASSKAITGLVDEFAAGLNENSPVYSSSREAANAWKDAIKSRIAQRVTFEDPQEVAKILTTRNPTAKEVANTIIGAGSPSAAPGAARAFDDVVKASGEKGGEVTKQMRQAVFHRILSLGRAPTDVAGADKYDVGHVADEITKLKKDNPELWNKFLPKQQVAMDRMRAALTGIQNKNSKISSIRNAAMAIMGTIHFGANYAATNAIAALTKASPDQAAEIFMNLLDAPTKSRVLPSVLSPGTMGASNAFGAIKTQRSLQP